jgi:hypothetical protein
LFATIGAELATSASRRAVRTNHDLLVCHVPAISLVTLPGFGKHLPLADVALRSDGFRGQVRCAGATQAFLLIPANVRADPMIAAGTILEKPLRLLNGSTVRIVPRLPSHKLANGLSCCTKMVSPAHQPACGCHNCGGNTYRIIDERRHVARVAEIAAELKLEAGIV